MASQSETADLYETKLAEQYLLPEESDDSDYVFTLDENPDEEVEEYYFSSDDDTTSDEERKELEAQWNLHTVRPDIMAIAPLTHLPSDMHDDNMPGWWPAEEHKYVQRLEQDGVFEQFGDYWLYYENDIHACLSFPDTLRCQTTHVSMMLRHYGFGSFVEGCKYSVEAVELLSKILYNATRYSQEITNLLGLSHISDTSEVRVEQKQSQRQVRYLRDYPIAKDSLHFILFHTLLVIVHQGPFFDGPYRKRITCEMIRIAVKYMCNYPRVHSPTSDSYTFNEPHILNWFQQALECQVVVDDDVHASSSFDSKNHDDLMSDDDSSLDNSVEEEETRETPGSVLSDALLSEPMYPDDILDDLEATDYMSHTALYRAGEMNDIYEVKRLLALGANVNHAVLGGRTMLINAVKHHRMELVQCLLEAKADVNAKEYIGCSIKQENAGEGYTALNYAFQEELYMPVLGNAAIANSNSEYTGKKIDFVSLLLAHGSTMSIHQRCFTLHELTSHSRARASSGPLVQFLSIEEHKEQNREAVVRYFMAHAFGFAAMPKVKTLIIAASFAEQSWRKPDTRGYFFNFICNEGDLVLDNHNSTTESLRISYQYASRLELSPLMLIATLRQRLEADGKTSAWYPAGLVRIFSTNLEQLDELETLLVSHGADRKLKDKYGTSSETIGPLILSTLKQNLH